MFRVLGYLAYHFDGISALARNSTYSPLPFSPGQDGIFTYGICKVKWPLMCSNGVSIIDIVCDLDRQYLSRSGIMNLHFDLYFRRILSEFLNFNTALGASPELFFKARTFFP